MKLALSNSLLWDNDIGSLGSSKRVIFWIFLTVFLLINLFYYSYSISAVRSATWVYSNIGLFLFYWIKSLQITPIVLRSSFNWEYLTLSSSSLSWILSSSNYHMMLSICSDSRVSLRSLTYAISLMYLASSGFRIEKSTKGNVTDESSPWTRF